jgi:hypothetical protein
MCGRFTATFEFSDIRVRWNLDRDLPKYTPRFRLPRMMIDDDTLKQLLRIDDELLQLCKFLNEKRDIEPHPALYHS